LKVRAFRHQAAWIDVNDGATAIRAEKLVAENRADFDHWFGQGAPQPVRERVLHVISGADGVLLSRRDGRWLLPAWSAAEDDGSWREMGSFDDLDEAAGAIFRHRVLSRAYPGGLAPDTNEAPVWVDGDALASIRKAEPSIDRVLSFVGAVS
ncbi:MAG TPA: hypothetical protein VEX87_10725, partial [Skermanella sp.]|nr:hypothetical protein [Skermanella sp.]